MSSLDRAAHAIVQRHPLQRLKSPSRGASSVLHILGLASFASSFKFLVDFPNPANEAFGWHFQYLTIIGLSLATTTFIFGVAADVTLSRKLFAVKNVLSFCSAPLEVLISVLYWSLRVIDRDLVLNPEWDEISLSADLGFHAMPAIMLAIDLLFFSPPWTLGSVPAFATSATIALIYWIWVDACYARNGWYPYPLFEVLDYQGRVILFVGSAVVMTLNTFLLGFLYGRVNRAAGNKPLKARARPGAAKE